MGKVEQLLDWLWCEPLTLLLAQWVPILVGSSRLWAELETSPSSAQWMLNGISFQDSLYLETSLKNPRANEGPGKGQLHLAYTSTPLNALLQQRLKLSDDIIGGNWSVKMFFNCDLNVFINLALWHRKDSNRNTGSPSPRGKTLVICERAGLGRWSAPLLKSDFQATAQRHCQKRRVLSWH